MTAQLRQIEAWALDVATVMRFYAHAREDATLSDAVFGNSPVGAQLVKVK